MGQYLGFLDNINYIHRVELIVFLSVLIFVLYVFYSLDVFSKKS